MIAIVTGGRDYADYAMMHAALSSYDPDEVWHGGARGADALADKWAEPWGKSTPFGADWKRHGRKAGPMRNQWMIDTALFLMRNHGEEFVVLAFPGGRGTEDCVQRATSAGLTVVSVTDDGFGPWRVTVRDEHGIILERAGGHVMSVAHEGKDCRDIGSTGAMVGEA